MEVLQEENEQLKRDIVEANEDRAKAAKYGLVLLEEKQAQAGQIEELNGLYDAARRELETAVEVCIIIHGRNGFTVCVLVVPYVVQCECSSPEGESWKQL